MTHITFEMVCKALGALSPEEVGEICNIKALELLYRYSGGGEVFEPVIEDISSNKVKAVIIYMQAEDSPSLLISNIDQTICANFSEKILQSLQSLQKVNLDGVYFSDDCFSAASLHIKEARENMLGNSVISDDKIYNFRRF